MENQIRGLAVVFGIRLPRALTRAFVNQALKASEGIAGLSAAMRGLIAARTAVMTAVAAIDADMRRMARASAGLQPADDNPRRGPVDRARLSISKCGDRRVRTLLYEAANVMLTRYKGQLKLKDWAFAIAKRSTMRKARVALARRLGIIMHAMLRDGTEFEFGLAPRNRQDRRPNLAPKRSDAQGGSRRRRRLRSTRPTAGRRRFQPSRPAPSLPHQVPNEHAENTGTRKRRYPEEPPALDSLENDIDVHWTFVAALIG